MNMQTLKKVVNQSGESTFKTINRLAETERFIAVLLTLIPLILLVTDFGAEGKFRSSISNYAYMCDSYWFGSLLGLAGALFIFNGAQHMKGYQEKIEEQKYLIANAKSSEADNVDNKRERFGKGYNIIFGIALFGVIYFDHLSFPIVHFTSAGIFYIGCALAMLFGHRAILKKWGVTLGVLTLVALGVHFLLNWIFDEDNHVYSLLWAEWVGLIFIAFYFVRDSLCYDPIIKKQ